VCRALGRLDEAEACYEEALPLALERIGPEHQQTLILQLNYGKLLTEAGRREEAARQLAAAEAGFRALYGADDRRTKIAAEALGAVLPASAAAGG
jgi:tetratricopeptide (TPR) repeat protein